VRLAIFLLPLREPLPLPHHATWTFLGEEHPELQNTIVVPTAEVGPIPDDFPGSLAVSIRVWQHQNEAFTEVEELERVAHVVEAILPPDEYRRLREQSQEDAEEDRDVPPIRPEKLEEFKAELESLDQPLLYSTIIEAVTPLVDRGGPDPLSDAFDAAVDGAAKLVRAFRISSKLPVSPLTRERLPFIIYFLTRNLVGKPEWSNGLFMTRPLPDPTFATEPIDVEGMPSFISHLGAIEVQHPLAPQVERRVDAALSLERLGDTTNAVILAELSGVIFLDVVLSLLYWDEGAAVEETAGALDRPFKSRLKREYAPRLGGDWDLTHRDGAVGRWYADLYLLRNRIVHGGHVPDRGEARTALDAGDDLAAFLCDRITARRDRFPRSALIVLGVDGLKRRDALSKRVLSVMGEFEDEHALFKQYVERDAAIDDARLET
jgi:hypothetical protein